MSGLADTRSLLSKDFTHIDKHTHTQISTKSQLRGMETDTPRVVRLLGFVFSGYC